MNSQDLGRILREKRTERGIDLDAAASATHIKRHYLQALENGDFGQLSSAAQVRGFLRAYATYLALDADELFKQLKQADQVAPAEQLPTPITRQNAEALSEADKQAAISFAAIGGELRGRREQMRLTLLEVAEHTHIPDHYLARLERGDFDSFPSPVQGRGMLSNYAEFLGLESEALLTRYGEALQQRFIARSAKKTPRLQLSKPTFSFANLKFKMPEWAQPFLSRDIAFGATAGLGLLIFIIFSIGRIISTRAAEQPQPTAPPLVDLLLANPTATSLGNAVAQSSGEPINLLEQQTATSGLLGQTTVQAGTGNISLRLLATQRTWMRVTVDGHIEFEGRTLPGQNYNFRANGQILLLTGNAAALRVFFNDQDLGILGVYGEVIQVIFNAQGAATPTVSPTPTINPEILTSTANAALTPSATPSPSPTETPTSTPTVDSGTPNP